MPFKGFHQAPNGDLSCLSDPSGLIYKLGENTGDSLLYDDDFADLFNHYPPVSPFPIVYGAVTPMSETTESNGIKSCHKLHLDGLLDGSYEYHGISLVFSQGKLVSMDGYYNDSHIISSITKATVIKTLVLPSPFLTARIDYVWKFNRQNKKTISNIKFCCAFLDNGMIWLFFKGMDENGIPYTEYGHFRPCGDLQEGHAVGSLLRSTFRTSYSAPIVSFWLVGTGETWLCYFDRPSISTDYDVNSLPPDLVKRSYGGREYYPFPIRHNCGLMKHDCVLRMRENPLFKLVADTILKLNQQTQQTLQNEQTL